MWFDFLGVTGGNGQPEMSEQRLPARVSGRCVLGEYLCDARSCFVAVLFCHAYIGATQGSLDKDDLNHTVVLWRQLVLVGTFVSLARQGGHREFCLGKTWTVTMSCFLPNRRDAHSSLRTWGAM